MIMKTSLRQCLIFKRNCYLLLVSSHLFGCSIRFKLLCSTYKCSVPSKDKSLISLQTLQQLFCSCKQSFEM